MVAALIATDEAGPYSMPQPLPLHSEAWSEPCAYRPRRLHAVAGRELTACCQPVRETPFGRGIEAQTEAGNDGLYQLSSLSWNTDVKYKGHRNCTFIKEGTVAFLKHGAMV